MEKVKNDEEWYLMSEDNCPGLVECYGEEYEKLYNKYVEEEKYTKKVKAQKIWQAMLVSQIETGMPYIAFKDSVNKKSNQKNIGTIKNGNLCIEQFQVSSETEYTCCNISTVSLPAFVETTKSGSKIFNYQKLYEVVSFMTVNMNHVIDKNVYAVPETKVSNFNTRPLIIGSQGLCSVFFEFGITYDSKQARELNKRIFETIQFAALNKSCDLAKEHGVYHYYSGSPISEGKFQHNLWGQEDPEGLWDWKELREKILKYGVRNSLLTGSPPTASTSQILGNYESFEPINSNFFIRSVKSGNFMVINKHLVKDLMKLNLWNEKMGNLIKSNRGSIQNISIIPQNIKDIYRSVFEITQKSVIEMSLDRSYYTCQGQSLNLHLENPTYNSLTSMLFYTYKCGLKTGMYYLRSRTKSKIQAFTVDQTQLNQSQQETLKTNENEEPLVCYKGNSDCAACSG
jgi:ribonucleoside-diphosphate reductase alpha chain